MSAASDRSSVESTLTSAIQQLERESALKKVSSTAAASVAHVPDYPRVDRARRGHCAHLDRRAEPPSLVACGQAWVLRAEREQNASSRLRRGHRDQGARDDRDGPPPLGRHRRPHPQGRVLPVSSEPHERALTPRYQFAVAPLLKSLVTNIALARFILHDELVPAFTAASLMGRELTDKPR